MRIKLSIISTLFIVLITTFSVSANENIYTNETFKFSITTNDNWTKPSDNDVYNFAKSTQIAKLTLVTSNEGYIIINIAEPNLNLTSLSLYDQSSLLRKQLLDLNDYFNITTVKKTTLNDIPFYYFTFDIKTDGVIQGKSYVYNTMISQNSYRLFVANVNEHNKAEIVKALKSINIEY